jgi:hypothetical protein
VVFADWMMLWMGVEERIVEHSIWSRLRIVATGVV